MPVYLPDARTVPVVVSHRKLTSRGQCGGEYEYEVITLPKVREVDADAAVPCPACGWVQDHMIAAERRRMYPRMIKWIKSGVVTWAFLLTSPLVICLAVYCVSGPQATARANFAPGMMMLWACLPVVGVTTLALWWYRRRLASRYDPNDEGSAG
jgi:hypothetical protein